MTYSILNNDFTITEEVPEGWIPIIEAFNYCVINDILKNGMPDVYNVVFSIKYGLLQVTYQGGNTATDNYAAFARSVSAKYCQECGSIATRDTFGVPKCNDCI